MHFPLARDQQGNPFTLPPDAAHWRVRRHTGGRPSTVLGPDGEPLFVGITSDRGELQAYGCNGSIPLEAVDGEYRSVRAPAAYVELGANGTSDTTRKADGQAESPELLRTSMESMVRTMEAMQRSQVERARAIGQREKAVTEAQIEMQRSHTQLIVALLDKATGGKPQDPLTLIQEQAKIQKALAAAGDKMRNAGAVEIEQAAPIQASEPPDSTVQTIAKWAGVLAPFVPHVIEPIAAAAGTPEKAAGLRRNAAIFGNLMGGFAGIVGGGAPVPAPIAIPEAIPTPVIVVDDDSDDPQASDDDDDASDEVRLPNKAVRQVLAMMEDDEAAALSDFVNRIEDDAFDDLERRASEMTSPDERLAWLRGLTFAATANRGEAVEESRAQEDTVTEATPAPPVVEAGPVETPAAPVGIPPGLVPVLVQLTPDEQIIGVQILQALDTATVEKLKADLLALPPDQALAQVRRIIAHAQQRAASVAHRAVMSVMSADAKTGS
jgi:hypothetical protein